MRKFIVFIIVCLFLGKGFRCGQGEKRLLGYLFDPKGPDAHNILERPAADDQQTINVYILLSLRQVIDVVENNQILMTNVRMDLNWKDYHFHWNPTAFNNITTLVIPANKVWRPDIVLYNSVEENSDETFSANVIVKSNSEMQNAKMFKSTCKINMLWYPFDTQKCEMKFASWTYEGNFTDLLFYCDNQTLCNQTIGKGNTEDLVENGEWDVISFTAVRNVMQYPCCSEIYVDILYYLEMKRRTLYYTFNFIVPCIIISTMALLGFLIPPDAVEKISLGVVVLLSLTVLLVMVAEKMPPGSESIPLIGMYFTCVMIVCSLSLVCNVLVLNLHHCSSDTIKIPDSLRRIVNVWLARLLFMKPSDKVSCEVSTPGYDKLFERNSIRNRSFQSGLMKGSKSLLANFLDMDNEIWGRAARSVNLIYGITDPENPLLESVTNQSDSMAQNILSKSDCHIREILCHLRQAKYKLEGMEIKLMQANEWKFAARVMDRFCLVVFSFVTIISSSAIILIK